MCGNGGDSEQTEQEVAPHFVSQGRAERRSGVGWGENRVFGSEAFPLTMMPVCEITEESRQCLGFNMKVVHDSQVRLEQMNILTAWPVPRNRPE